MSGVVGIVHFDGAPVDPELLQRMTDFMKFRGPDAQQCFVKDNVGFGHTLLRTTFESEHEQQPFTLDGETWIIADARVDAQEELRAKLEGKGETPQGVTDVELILRAYRAWGEDCVEYLLGDFSFAIWDGPQRRLFCARDHLGVKPFFYAQLGSTLIVSNTLDCIRQHPRVSAELNDLAIADFLLFEMNMDPATTSFADIQRIPPAHRAVWWAEGKLIERYWTLPIDEPVYYKREEDYTERFRELLDTAVSDRLRTNKVGVFMSGGLDSPTLAATACTILRGQSSIPDVHAFTSLVNGFDGGEQYYAQLVADHLKISIRFWDRTPSLADEDWCTDVPHTPEPVSYPIALKGLMEEYEAAEKVARVWFYGEGPDNALHYEWRPYLRYMWKQHQYSRFLVSIVKQVIRNSHIPLVGAIRAKLKMFRFPDPAAEFPSWLEPSFVEEYGLLERWKTKQSNGLSTHRVRPLAHASFEGLLWERLCSGFDSGLTGAAIEVRHPFLDLRLLRYMLTVPPMPWCRGKYLLRRAMRNSLPKEVLSRQKTPISRCGTLPKALPSLQPVPDLVRYLNPGRVPTEMAKFDNLSAYALSAWLRTGSRYTASSR